MAYPLVTALVVLPTASSASVDWRTSLGRPAISAMPPALSVTGPKASRATIMPARPSIGGAEGRAELVRRNDARDDDQRRKRGRFKRDREALDHVGAVAGDRRLRNRHDRALAGSRVIFGDDDDQTGDHKPNQAADEEVRACDDLAGDRADI